MPAAPRKPFAADADWGVTWRRDRKANRNRPTLTQEIPVTTVTPAAVASAVRALRKKLGLSLRATARLTKLSHHALHRVEHGKPVLYSTMVAVQNWLSTGGKRPILRRHS